MKLLERIDTLLQALALAAFVLVAILAHGEISSRLEYLSHVDAMIAEYDQRIVSKLQMQFLQRMAAGQDSTVSDQEKLIAHEIDTREELVVQRLSTVALIVNGCVTTGKTLGQIIDSDDYDLKHVDYNATHDARMVSANIFDRATWYLGLRFDVMPSNTLFSLFICSCGAIGALAAGLRTNEFTTYRDICLGLGTGFICYLAIRGGRDIFTTEGTGGKVTPNPYNSGIAAVLAGLFSERFFRLLSLIFDSISERMRDAFRYRTESSNAPNRIVPEGRESEPPKASDPDS